MLQDCCLNTLPVDIGSVLTFFVDELELVSFAKYFYVMTGDLSVVDLQIIFCAPSDRKYGFVDQRRRLQPG